MRVLSPVLYPRIRNGVLPILKLAPDVPRAVVSFKRQLERNPRIANNVRRLEFCLQRHDYQDPAVPQVLSRLHNLQSLDLDSNMEAKPDWNTLPPDLRSSLLHLFRLPTLQHLSMSFFKNIPITAFMACTNVTHLKLENVLNIWAPDLENDIEHLLQHAIPTLRSVSILDCPDSLKTLVSTRRADNHPAINFAHLRHIEVDMMTLEEVSAVGELMGASKELESIDCTVPHDVGMIEFSTKLISSGSLRTLKSLTVFLILEDEDCDPLLGLPDALAKIRGINRLEELTITSSVNTDNYCSTNEEIWGKLDDVLTEDSSFAKLRRVSLKVDLNTYFSGQELLKERLERMREKCFSSLTNSSKIEFNFLINVIQV